MIFYFTGTGNSLYVAKRLDPERVSIPQAAREARPSYEADVIGVVCPIYGHEMPGMVKDFLRRAVFRTGYFYLVLTYGNNHGGATELAAQELERYGKRADYINVLKMVDNFLPAFDMEEQIASEPEKRIEEQTGRFRMILRSADGGFPRSQRRTGSGTGGFWPDSVPLRRIKRAVSIK